MICPKCGAQNMDGVTFCGSCGAQLASFTPPVTPEESQQSVNYSQQQPSYGSQPNVDAFTTPLGGPANGGLVPPKNYMTESILVTVISLLCCCSPISIVLGIIAIIKANNVNAEFSKGNIFEANSNADSAKKLALWAAIVAVITVILFYIAYFVFFAAIIKEAGGLEDFFRTFS